LKLRAPFLPILLLVSMACDRSLVERRKTLFVPWEEGLTLVYEDPTLPDGVRFQERFQRRISASRPTPAGRRVTIVYTTLKSNNTFDFLSREGGWAMVEGDTPLFKVLPEGFPDKVDRWEDKARGMTFQLLGRATLQNPDLKLPDDFERTGLWVEMQTRDGARKRIFFLPDIGEAESRILQNGRWVAVNRLVSRGFTDLPTASAP